MLHYTYTATGQKISQHYPFGMAIPSQSFALPNENDTYQNRYLYNGKEYQDDFGLNWYDYGARFYDAQIGRFHTQDRFAEMYYHMTPYQYGGNNPIAFIDINGDSIWHVNPNGYVTHTGVGDRYYEGTHTLYAVNEDGETGESLAVQEGSILDQLSEVTEVTETTGWDAETGEITEEFFFSSASNAGETVSNNEMFDLFFFLADNSSNAEWRLHETMDGSYGIGTLHAPQDSPRDNHFGLKTENVHMMIHSHPLPRTREAEVRGLSSDIVAARRYPKFYVYMPRSGFIYHLPKEGNKVRRFRR